MASGQGELWYFRQVGIIRVVSKLHIRSVHDPLADSEVVALAIALLSRADAMGLLPERITRLNLEAMAGLEQGLADAGIGQSMVGELHRLEHMRRSERAELLKKMVDALNESPAPAHEWRAVGDILGLELLARLLGISASSARRYMSGARVTPDEVAARLHFLAFVVGDLNGAYNEIGVRRWFDRRRALLEGGTPAGLLSGNWLPEHEGPRRVRRLAHSLAHVPAT